MDDHFNLYLSEEVLNNLQKKWDPGEHCYFYTVKINTVVQPQNQKERKCEQNLEGLIAHYYKLR